MVQVDIFWSYGLSAGLALAAGKKLKNETSFWDNKYFNLTLIWSALIFAPSGIYLLWTNPGWETMFVAESHSSIPAWLVCLFAFTNITQGILGFYFTWWFLRRGNQRAAAFQTIWAHTAMLLVLVFGWDGAGYKRFFYAGTGTEWHQGTEFPLTAFFSSNIFYSLLLLGVFFIPTYFGLINYLRKTS
jgi:hypothetical protein